MDFGKDLTRLVFRELGNGVGKNGRPVHRVEFAYACDQMQAGIDKPVPNPYLKSYRVKEVNGKVRISHADYLSEPVYQRLMKYSSAAGMESCRWDGMVCADVNSFITEKGKSMVYVDLSRQAEAEGRLSVPATAFAPIRHDCFVKQSLAEVGRQRTAEALHRLPQVSESLSDVSLEL